MKLVIFIFLCFINLKCFGVTFTSKVHSIESNLIKFSNGRVGFLKKSSPLPSRGQVVEAHLNHSSQFLSFRVVSEETHFQTKDLLSEGPLPFEPTILNDLKEAEAIFHRSNSFYKRISECSDRAHVWAHDEFKYSGVNSLKAFVFFTASYINSVGFKWWFHVAPMYRTNIQGQFIDLVMDYRYSDRPLTVKEWTDLFVYTKRSCKVTTKFSEYDVNPQTENCYLMIESMHYQLPGEIFDQERYSRYKNQTSDFEIRASKKRAFE
jgi:hypothetical protein